MSKIVQLNAGFPPIDGKEPCRHLQCVYTTGCACTLSESAGRAVVERLKSVGHSLAQLVRHPARPDVRESVLDPRMPDAVRERIRNGQVPHVHLDEKYLIKPR